MRGHGGRLRQSRPCSKTSKNVTKRLTKQAHLSKGRLYYNEKRDGPTDTSNPTKTKATKANVTTIHAATWVTKSHTSRESTPTRDTIPPTYHVRGLRGTVKGKKLRVGQTFRGRLSETLTARLSATTPGALLHHYQTRRIMGRQDS